MPDWRAQAKKIAREERVPVPLFFSLIDHESGWKEDISSPAGARGFTQLMPKTAAGLGVDIDNPLDNLRGGARYLRLQLDAFGSPRLALAAYNAGPNAVRDGRWLGYKETVRYVRNVLAGARRYGGAGVSKLPVAEVTPSGGVKTTIPQPLSQTGGEALPGLTDPLAEAAFQGLGKIAAGWKPETTLNELIQTVSSQPAGASVPSPTPVDQFTPTPASPPVSGRQAQPPAPLRGHVQAVKPGGGWAGSQGVVQTLARLAGGLEVTSAKRDRRLTKTGRTSDHWTGSTNAYAEDLSDGVATPQMDAAAQRIARALGSGWTPEDGALELTVVRNGYRIQVLYRTHLGGNHFTHIHLGAKRVSS